MRNLVAAYPVVHKNTYYCVRLMIRYSGMHFRPFAEIIHHDENISVSGVTALLTFKGRYPLERAPKVYHCSWARLLLTGPCGDLACEKPILAPQMTGNSPVYYSLLVRRILTFFVALSSFFGK